MADNQFSVRVPNALEALMAGEQAYTSGQQDNARKEASALWQSGDTQGALARLLSANDPKNITALGHYQQSANGVYGTPIYGTDPATGKTVLGAIGKQGQFNRLDTGGVEINPGVKIVDTGTGHVVVDSRSGSPVGQPGQPALQPGQPPVAGRPAGYIPTDVAGKAREAKYGQEVGDRQADLGKAKSSLDSSISNVDRMADVARSIKADPALASITGVQGVFPNWPGGRAANVQARLDNLTSQAGFAVLQAMRDASKTGGALGSVSDFENRQLQNNLAALQRAQSADQFKSELDKLIQWGDGVKQRLQAAYDQDFANLPKPNASAQPTTNTAPPSPRAPRINEERDGFRYKGGNPADPASWVQTR